MWWVVSVLYLYTSLSLFFFSCSLTLLSTAVISSFTQRSASETWLWSSSVSVATKQPTSQFIFCWFGFIIPFTVWCCGSIFYLYSNNVIVTCFQHNTCKNVMQWIWMWLCHHKLKDLTYTLSLHVLNNLLSSLLDTQCPQDSFPSVNNYRNFEWLCRDVLILTSGVLEYPLDENRVFGDPLGDQ